MQYFFSAHTHQNCYHTDTDFLATNNYSKFLQKPYTNMATNLTARCIANSTTLKFFFSAIMLLLLTISNNGWGQANISAGSTITQNFDAALGTSNLAWTNNSTVAGWYISSASTLIISTGTTATGQCLNLGVAGTNPITDRALGCLQSSSTNQRFGLRLLNNGTSSIISFNISFTGEQWRSFNAGNLIFEYQIGTNLNSLTAGTWTAATAFDFASLQTSNGTALDGNASANRTSISGTLTVTVAANTEIFFRWTRNTNSSPILAIDDLSITANAASNFYYKGSGALNDINSWGTNINGSGTPPANFSDANQFFNLRNATSISTASSSGVWTVSGAGSKVILNDNAGSPITLTIASGNDISVPTGSFDVVAPSSGNNKIIYQNSGNALSLGTVGDANLAIDFDGANFSSSTTKTFGNVTLKNGANINLSGAAMVVANLTIDPGCTLSGAFTSTNYIAIKSDGAVVINGTFKTGRPGGLVTTGVIIPVTTSGSFNALLFQNATENITIGPASTIEYYRGTTSNTGPQTIEARTYNNLILSNSAVASNKQFATTGTINITGTFSVANMASGATISASVIPINIGPLGRIVNNSSVGVVLPLNNVTLKSDATGTASIGNSTGAYSGSVTVERFIPGKRAFRFFAHPFSNAIALNQLTGAGEIDITGAGGATNGFTTTTTNNPSAFSYNTANGNSALSPDPGWEAYTSANTASWASRQGIRILVRGAKGEGLDGNAYTPSAATIFMTGTLNDGSSPTFTLTSSANSNYNLIGNPLASPIDLSLTTRGSAVSSNFSVWNPDVTNAGNKGVYVTQPFATPYILPIGSAFFAQTSDGAANNTIQFTESSKSAATPASLFRGSSTFGTNSMNLELTDSVGYADRLLVFFDKNQSSANKDWWDADKLMNPDVNFYSTSSDNYNLSIDARPFPTVGGADMIIPVKLYSAVAKTLTLTAKDFDIQDSRDVLLHDKYTGTWTILNKDVQYCFTVTTDALTQGNRFEIVMRGSNSLPVNILNVSASQKNAGIEVNWNTASESNMDSYEVEESSNATTFTKAATVGAKNGASNAYNWFDATVNNGDNYYRIKAIEKNGTVKYSNVVKVKIGGKNAEFTVYPNPVKDGIINLQMSNVEKGIYTVKIFNNAGQEVANRRIINNGGSATETITLDKGTAKGNYKMQITNGTTSVIKSVIVD